MKLLVIVKATQDSEVGIMPSEAMLREMGEFNEQLVKAGVMIAGEGLHPSIKGKRIQFSGKNRTIVDGPFAETKELVSGFWIWQVKSMDDAVEWIRRSPFQDGEVELRPVFEMDDFGAAATPDIRERAARHQAEIDKRTRA